MLSPPLLPWPHNHQSRGRRRVLRECQRYIFQPRTGYPLFVEPGIYMVSGKASSFHALAEFHSLEPGHVYLFRMLRSPHRHQTLCPLLSPLWLAHYPPCFSHTDVHRCLHQLVTGISFCGTVMLFIAGLLIFLSYTLDLHSVIL